MLPVIYYIATPDLVPQTTITDTDHILALQLYIGNESDLLMDYRIANTLLPSCHFCLSVNVTKKIEDKAVNDIISFFFYPNYYEQKNIPVIIVQYNNLENLEAFRKALTHWAKAQGFAAIDMQQVLTGTILYANAKAEQVRQAYRGLLNSPDSEGSIYIKVSKPTDISAMDQMLEEEKQAFKHQNTSLYLLKEQNKKLAEQLQQLEVMYAAAEQEISNQQSHIHILRSQSQATHLQHYYTNEYEILPVWYKRFGHMIKVITGKRTFRSLFNDNVKKYKD